MTILSTGTLVIMACLAVGCSSSSGDYGSATGTTTIDVKQNGGFIAGATRGVRIVGTTATYDEGSVTEQATVDTADVAAMIDALEQAKFLDLRGDYTTCSNRATDLPTVTISVKLSAGTNTVDHYLGCSGGTFDVLATLDQHLFELSGFAAWEAGL